MADLQAQLEISADASGVEAGVGRAKKSLASLGATAEQAGKRAAEGIDKIGGGGEQAAAKVDRSTKSLINSIQRTTSTLEAGGRANRQYFETLARQRGIDTSALKPYLDQLDQVKAKQEAAAAALAAANPAFSRTGLTAKQTAAALRQVPAQFTDIVVALQGGQAPLTVLLQQGGQLKDVFGGIAPAARALGGFILGLVNPLTVAAAAVAALGLAYFKGSREANQFANALILTGNAAGTTVDELTDMARRIDEVTGTQASATKALAEVAKSGRVAAENLERFTLVAIQLEKVTGQAVSETAKQFADLAKSPLDAVIKLNDGTNFLTQSLYQQIRALEEQGRVTEAANLAQTAYANSLETRLSQVNDRLGFVERAWRTVTGAARDAWDAMLNVGRPDTASQRLAGLRAELETLNQGAGVGVEFGGISSAQREARIAQIEAEISALEAASKATTKKAKADAAAAKQLEARIRFDKAGEQFLSNQAKLEREIAQARAEGAAAGASQAEIEARIGQIREKLADKSRLNKLLAINRAQLASDVDAIRQANELILGSYRNAESILESVRAAGLVSDREYYEAKRAFIQLETEAKEQALQQEIARYQQEKLIGRDRIENERKIAEATTKLTILRADAAARLVVLANQEAAAAARLELSFLTARQAAEDYFQTLQRQQDREIAGIGRGNEQRRVDQGLSQIEDRFAGQRRDLENQRAQLELEGKFTEESRRLYDERLGIINEYQDKVTQSFLVGVERRRAAEENWLNGATEAYANYLESARNVAAQVEGFFDNAFRGMEEALVDFIRTGKLDFKSLADSIVADITRIIVRQQLVRAFSFAGDAAGGSTGFFGQLFGALVGGGRAIGGPVRAGVAYPVNERGRPEVLNVGARQWLLPTQDGKVTPNANAPSAPQQVIQNFHFSSPTDRRTQLQVGAEAQRGLQQASRNL
jgi:lambda family phage tail tape measure protein